jgi:hypothetical protein
MCRNASPALPGDDDLSSRALMTTEAVAGGITGGILMTTFVKNCGSADQPRPAARPWRMRGRIRAGR